MSDWKIKLHTFSRQKVFKQYYPTRENEYEIFWSQNITHVSGVGCAVYTSK